MASAASKIRAHIGECDSVIFDNSTGSTVNGATIQVVGNKVGIVKEDVDDGSSTPMYVEVPGPGVDLPRNTGDSAWSIGDEVFLDTDSSNNSTGEFTIQSTTNTTSNPSVGYAYLSTAAGDSEGRVVLTNENV